MKRIGTFCATLLAAGCFIATMALAAPTPKYVNKAGDTMSTGPLIMSVNQTTTAPGAVLSVTNTGGKTSSTGYTADFIGSGNNVAVVRIMQNATSWGAYGLQVMSTDNYPGIYISSAGGAIRGVASGGTAASFENSGTGGQVLLVNMSAATSGQDVVGITNGGLGVGLYLNNTLAGNSANLIQANNVGSGNLLYLTQASNPKFTVSNAGGVLAAGSVDATGGFKVGASVGIDCSVVNMSAAVVTIVKGIITSCTGTGCTCP